MESNSQGSYCSFRSYPSRLNIASSFSFIALYHITIISAFKTCRVWKSICLFEHRCLEITCLKILEVEFYNEKSELLKDYNTLSTKRVILRLNKLLDLVNTSMNMFIFEIQLHFQFIILFIDVLLNFQHEKYIINIIIFKK